MRPFLFIINILRVSFYHSYTFMQYTHIKVSASLLKTPATHPLSSGVLGSASYSLGPSLHIYLPIYKLHASTYTSLLPFLSFLVLDKYVVLPQTSVAPPACTASGNLSVAVFLDQHSKKATNHISSS